MRSLNLPTPLLQATVWVKIKIKPVARNVMEGGYTERKPFIHQTHLTEPQGKLKNLLFLRVVL